MRSSSKVKFWDPMEEVVHDFPPVCRINKEKKPLNNSHNFDSKLVECHPAKNNKLKSLIKPKELGLNKPSFGSRHPGKVKFYDPTCSKDDYHTQIHANTIDSRKREKIHEAMILFEKVYTQLFQENGSKQMGEKIAHWRVPMEAAKMVKQKLKWMTPDKALGQIRGVHPGDMFKFRTQLQMVGLHCQPNFGIDYTKINGKSLAISIVDSHRYSNERESCNVLLYCGEGGGAGFLGCKRQVAPEDQKLERGNLALKNSMDAKSPVRVIKKLFGVGFGKKKSDVFVYDGLYTVNHFTQKRGLEGKMVFMFEMHKIPGQSHFQKGVNAMHALYHHSTFEMLF